MVMPALLAAEMSPCVLTDELRCMSGRRMLPLEVKGANLQGRTPTGAGAPFRVLSGSEVLWEGGADEVFRVAMPAGCTRVYLMAQSANNTAWKQLAWEGERPSPPMGNQREIHAESEGLLPSKMEDAGPALRRLLSKLRGNASPQALVLAPGEYHFWPQGALEMSYYVSNHDQQDTHAVGVPLVDMEKLTLRGEGVRFVFHGKMQPVLVMDSDKVTISGITIDYATPFNSEGVIVEQDDASTTLEFDPLYSWRVEGGRFLNVGEGWQEGINHALAFKPTGQLAPGTSDIAWSSAAQQVGEHRVRFAQGCKHLGLAPGDCLTLRSYWRPHPAMILYRAHDTVLEGVVFYDSQGMALLAQRSGNITIRGGGCVRPSGGKRMHTASADATHFSNCHGLIDVQGALYEGMMDDAINVHATCLRIKEVTSPTELLAEYVHGQAIGFEVLLSGEEIQWIAAKTLENNEELSRAKQVQRINERTLRIVLEKPLPAGIGVGDALENAHWHPEVIFKNNTVRHNRARGSLFTTPNRVLVEGNRFVEGSGCAILLAGDAQGWYESGRCLNVQIRHNLFQDNLTSRFQFTEGIISIYPEVKEPQAQKVRYHQNIVIEDNHFITHRVPLLFAISARGVRLRHNTIDYHDRYPAMYGGKAFILRHCEEMECEPPLAADEKK